MPKLKKIRKLLRRIANEFSYLGEPDDYITFHMYDDCSGQILTGTGKEIISFGSIEHRLAAADIDIVYLCTNDVWYDDILPRIRRIVKDE